MTRTYNRQAQLRLFVLYIIFNQNLRWPKYDDSRPKYDESINGIAFLYDIYKLVSISDYLSIKREIIAIIEEKFLSPYFLYWVGKYWITLSRTVQLCFKISRWQNIQKKIISEAMNVWVGELNLCDFCICLSFEQILSFHNILEKDII